MRLQHFHLLLTLARTGSLRASAQILSVSQPALTKALRQLEEEFGTALVVRTPKGVRLAPAGELLAARAATVVREIERAREEVAWHLRHAEAQVTIGVSPVAAILLAPGAVARFGKRWPQVRLRMRDTLYPRALEQLRTGELDLALGPLPGEGAGRDLLVQPLFESQALLAARRGHPLARAKKLAQLVDAGWVLTGPAGGPGDPRNLSFDATGERTPQVRLECESFATLLALMPSLDVIGIMPRGFFDRYGPAMDLVELPITDVLPNTTIHAVYRADAPLTLPAQRLLDAFIAEARAQRKG
ncbi:CysJI operon transcriptional activator [Variovorax sp. SRS16]|uniref:LysR family transcriptional regulator n=1 Tax=Variovorax sp. SRS16 TaxID=282217 RepID=UPI001316E2A1|nr:LysR substrate-binding domain-containing protein [Variovorax sp. SRS16]VTU16749.1 CysJI operon transcriptional activator [Variovorax sp. SRS16]